MKCRRRFVVSAGATVKCTPVVGVKTIIRNGEDVEIQGTTGRNVEYVHTQGVIGHIDQEGIVTCIIKEYGDMMM